MNKENFVKSCDELINASKSLYENKKYDNLISNYKAIISYKKQSPPDFSKDIYKYYSNLSHINFLIRDFSAALISAEECIKLKPDWYKGYYRAAKACEGLNDYEKTHHYYEKMQDYLQNINIAEHKKIMNDYHNQNINILKEWLINNGAHMGDISIEYYDTDYRGVTVHKEIKKGSNIIQIPFNCCISLEESKTRGYNKKLKELGLKYTSPHTYIALELLDIKNNKDHKLTPYIKCLPQYFSNVPINFTENELEHLKGSFSLVKIAQKKQSLRNEYDNIVNALENHGGFKYSFEEFVWARTVVITRIYAAERTINGENIRDSLLVPLADMANHKIPPNTHWFFNKDKNMFIVKATDYLNPGENLFESYGPKCNYRYFVNYGFTILDNHFEEVCLGLHPIIYGVLENKMYTKDETHLNFLNNTPDLFQIGYDMRAETFQEFLKKCRDKCYELNPNAENNYIEAFSLIVGFSTRMLNMFNTTPEEDENLLLTENNFNIRNCIIQRRGEKQLLNFYIMYFSGLINIINAKKEDKKKLSKSLKKKLNKPFIFGFKEYIDKFL